MPSPLAEICEWQIPLLAGTELSVAATKSYIAMLSLSAQIVADWEARSTRLRGRIGFLTEAPGLWDRLTVRDNLELGAFSWSSGGSARQDQMDRVFELFPIRQVRAAQAAGTLSGGQQQMLAIGRGLMARPKLLLLDEPSLGLAPMVVRELFRVVRRLNEEEGLTVLVVEQNAGIALDVSSRAYVLEVGRVAVEGSSDELRRHEGVRRSYLGY